MSNAVLVRQLRDDRDLIHRMTRVGYRQPEFRDLVLGWADRMDQAADTIATLANELGAARAALQLLDDELDDAREALAHAHSRRTDEEP